MSAFSNFLENELLDHVLNNASYTSPTTVYLALFSDDPTDADSGTEATGGSYARQAASFTTASSGSCSTDADITFSSMPAMTVTNWGLYDASTAGNLLYHGAFDNSIALSATDDFTVSSGNLTINHD